MSHSLIYAVNTTSLQRSSVDEIERMAANGMFSAFLDGEPGETEDGPKDSLQMYVEAAAVALNSVATQDPQAANLLRGVIDYLVSDARLKPGELDEQRKLNNEALEQIELMQKKIQQFTRMSLMQNARMKKDKDEVARLNQKVDSLQADLEQVTRERDANAQSISVLNQKIQTQITEFVDAKVQRDNAVRRQNQLIQKSNNYTSRNEKLILDIQTHKANIERMTQENKALNDSLKRAELSIEEKDEAFQQLRYEKAQLDEQLAQLTSQMKLNSEYNSNMIMNLTKEKAYLVQEANDLKN